jgi:hypothetical protein
MIITHASGVRWKSSNHWNVAALLHLIPVFIFPIENLHFNFIGLQNATFNKHRRLILNVMH